MQPPKKQIGIAQGFGVLVETLEEMREAAAFKGLEEAAKAMREKQAIKEMTVWIQTNPFSDSPQYPGLHAHCFSGSHPGHKHPP